VLEWSTLIYFSFHRGGLCVCVFCEFITSEWRNVAKMKTTRIRKILLLPVLRGKKQRRPVAARPKQRRPESQSPTDTQDTRGSYHSRL